MPNLILASESPRRARLLEAAGLTFQIVRPNVNEHFELSEPPDGIVRRLSWRKAETVRPLVERDAVILAADTLVIHGGAVLGKPRDAGDAFRMLTLLSGGWHQVYTGVTLLCGETVLSESERTDVKFRALSPEEIRRYIATGEPADKAGAYGIQGRGAMIVERIEGDYFNVVGLPMHRLGRMLGALGFQLFGG